MLKCNRAYLEWKPITKANDAHSSAKQTEKGKERILMLSKWEEKKKSEE